MYASIGVWPCMSYIFLLFCGKEQFIYDLPARLGKCIKSEAYADAVKFYTGALPIFKVTYFLPDTLMVGSIFFAIFLSHFFGGIILLFMYKPLLQKFKLSFFSLY